MCRANTCCVETKRAIRSPSEVITNLPWEGPDLHNLISRGQPTENANERGQDSVHHSLTVVQNFKYAMKVTPLVLGYTNAC